MAKVPTAKQFTGGSPSTPAASSSRRGLATSDAGNRSPSPVLEANSASPDFGPSGGSQGDLDEERFTFSYPVNVASSPAESSSGGPGAHSRTPSVTVTPAASPSARGTRSESIASRVGNMNPSTPRSSLGMSEVLAAIDNVTSGSDEQIPLPEPRTPDLQGRSPRSPALRKSRSSTPLPQPRYDGEDEELPPHRLHDPAVQQGFTNAKALMTSLAGVLGSGSLHTDASSTILRLRQQAQVLADFQCPSTRTVGFVGDSGAGKSSLLNALLDRKDLARTSGGGAACTCVATEYHYHDIDNFALDMEVFTTDELKEQVTDLLKSYRHYHLHAQDMSANDDIGHAKKTAKTALDTFQAMFRGRLNNKELLLAEPEDFVRSTLHSWIEAIKPQQPAEPEVVADREQCSDRLAALTSEMTSEGESALWPYIRKIKVFLKAPILGKGLVLVDLPGLADLNSARQAITTRYVRDCDEIFAVCDISRATTDAKVAAVFELARQAKLSSVGIICTRSDVIIPGEARRGLHGPTATRVQRLINAVTANQRVKNRLEGERSAFVDYSFDELDDEERERSIDLSRQLTRVARTLESDELELHTILVEDRNSSVISALRDSYRTNFPEIRSTPFCVGSIDYWNHREKPKDKALPVLRLSGILAVRTHCLSMVADNQLRIITKYIRDDIPALLGDVALWVESGAESADAEQRRAVRETLDIAEDGLKRALQGHDSLINGTPELIKDRFDSHIYNRQRTREWAQHAVEAGNEWATWYHSTYAAFVRKYGNHWTRAAESHNWNAEAIEAMVTDLQDPWQALLDTVSQHHNNIKSLIKAVLNGTIGRIEALLAMSPASTATLSQTLIYRRNVFVAEVEDICHKFDTDIQSLAVDAFSGLRFSLIGKALEDTYNSCRNDHGSGVDARRKATMKSALQRHDLFPKLMRDFRRQFSSLADDFGEGLKNATETHLEDIHQTLDVARNENVVTESQENPEFRNRVATEHEKVKATVERIKGAFDA